MDFSLIFTLIAIIPLFLSARSLYKFTKWNKEYNRQRRERDELIKLRMHLIDNRISKKECICTPECLNQTKLLRLQALLPPPPFELLPRLTREGIGSRFAPTASSAQWLRSMQFMSEASFGAP